MLPDNLSVRAFVEEIAALARPDRVHWCDGTEEERRRLSADAVAAGILIPLDARKRPGCYYHRSDPRDVARTEDRTFICTRSPEDAGPTNNWMAPEQAYEKCRAVLRDSMRGRTLYVIPFLMGPPGSRFSKVGVQLTDSVYVVLNMRIMTRMGAIAWEHLGRSGEFVRCVHGMARLDPEERYICHFPDDYAVWSVSSNYGGNALLNKKCFALRLAGVMARREGWLAEHMLISGIESPAGEITWFAAAFPSACGKTNLAMMRPPARFAGWKVHALGDDIAWIRPGPDGRLWAINPEAGFFGVAPGTNAQTNPNMMAALEHDTIFTNTALTPDGDVWWEGMDHPAPPGTLDWRGRPWSPESGHLAAHPNSRFTTPVTNCPALHPKWNDPEGVPISAILVGARRTNLVPLVYESFDWAHGVYLGATLSSETTAAAAGKVGVRRRDPFAMLPFCGMNMADYFRHWLDIARGREDKMPRIYRVNWFRKDSSGRFLWPGFGENFRVLKWIVDRAHGRAAAIDTPIGRLPAPGALALDGLDLPQSVIEELFAVRPAEWIPIMEEQREFFARFGARLPPQLEEVRRTIHARLQAA